jgi:hypothetical protein
MFLFIYAVLCISVGYFHGWLIGIGTFIAAWLVSFGWGMLNIPLPPLFGWIKHVVIIGSIVLMLILPNL